MHPTGKVAILLTADRPAEARFEWASRWLSFAPVVVSPESRETSMEPYIDAHSHVWTPDVAHYPLAPGWRVGDMQPRSFTAEELLAQCRPAGVGRVNLIQMSFYEFGNRYLLDMIKLYPD